MYGIPLPSTKQVAQKCNEMKKRNIIAIIALVVIIVSGIAHDVTTGKSLVAENEKLILNKQLDQKLTFLVANGALPHTPNYF